MIQDDNSIPLLTEVIPPLSPPVTPAYFPDPGGQPSHDVAVAWSDTFSPPPSTVSDPTPVAPAQFSPPLSAAEQSLQWEQEIRENVLQNLLAQVDTVLQQHLQDQMAVALDNLSDIVTQRVKESLRTALAETVTRAVAEEMARFSSSKNQTT